jgi:nucleoside-diphosphate-sugar epimerase
MGKSISRAAIPDSDISGLIEGHASAFHPLRNSSILITGATGWFGVWLLDSLLAADDALRLGLRITAVSRDPRRFIERFPAFEDVRLTWLTGDVRNLEFDAGSFSHVIHGAADTLGGDVDSQLDNFNTILEGTRRVLASATAGATPVLLLSSGAIYGPPTSEHLRFSEGDCGGPNPANPKSAYAEGKRAAELLGSIAAAQGAKVRIARCFAFAGPHMPFDKHFAIGNFIADAVLGREIRVKSDGRPLRSYMYMTDLIRALLAVLNNGATGGIYNVGSDQAVSIEMLAHAVNRVVGGRGVQVGGNPTHWSENYVPNTSRLRTDFAFHPEVPLDEAIARTAAWYRENNAKSLP